MNLYSFICMSFRCSGRVEKHRENFCLNISLFVFPGCWLLQNVINGLVFEFFILMNWNAWSRKYVPVFPCLCLFYFFLLSIGLVVCAFVAIVCGSYTTDGEFLHFFFSWCTQGRKVSNYHLLQCCTLPKALVVAWFPHAKIASNTF